MIAAFLAVALLAGLSGLLVIEVREHRERQWQAVQLRFGRDVSPEALGAVLDQLAGLPRGAAVALSIQADHAGISHYLEADQATLQSLRGALHAVLPGLRLEASDAASTVPSAYRYGRAIRLRGRAKVLRTDDSDIASAALLGAMQPLGKDEALLLRWLIVPSHPVTVPDTPSGQVVSTEHRRLLRAKNDGAVLRARGWLAASAGHPKRAAHLLGRVNVVLRSRGTAYGYLRSGAPLGRSLERVLRRRRLVIGERYSTAELVPLLGWPVGAPMVPGLALGTSPLLVPSSRLPQQGRLLGNATWPGSQRPISQPVLGALSHTLIAGPTGVGKSTLLTNLIAADIAAGRGVVLIDGKCDTASAVQARIPAERQADVVVLDCASAGSQPGLKLFGGGQPELAADVVLGVLSDLFRDSWGPLSERYLRAGLVAVAHDSEGTLADVPFVYSDAAYRRRLSGRLRDPLTRATLSAYEAMSPGERHYQLAAPLGKLGALLGRPIVRTVLGQANPRLDFSEVLVKRRIIVISLAPARVGAPAARLIGALSLFALFQAVQARASLAERARRPFFVYVDEPKALGELPMPLDALLEQARGLGVGVTLAPQSVSQLPTSVREAALTNVATRVVFRQDADDARLLARDLRGITAEDLGDLAAYEAVARIGLGPGDIAPPVTLKTEPAVKPSSDPEQLRRAAQERSGMNLDEVDAALEKRHRQAASYGTVGRRRRLP